MTYTTLSVYPISVYTSNNFRAHANGHSISGKTNEIQPDELQQKYGKTHQLKQRVGRTEEEASGCAGDDRWGGGNKTVNLNLKVSSD